MVNRILFFLLNGAGTLILETLWLKKHTVVFGAIPESYGSILFAYFCGITAGSWFFRTKDGATLSKKKLYGGFVVALIFSYIIPWLLNAIPFSGDFVLGTPLLYRVTLWSLAVLSIFPACFFMGSFFPLVARTIDNRLFVFLYGIQTLGALFGIYFGSFYLPYSVGYRAAFAVGIAINAFSLYFLNAIFKAKGPLPDAVSDTAVLTWDSMSALLSGLLSLSLQVLWIRLLSLNTDNSIYAFGSASLLILLQLTISSYIISKVPTAWLGKNRLLGAILALSVLSITFSTWIYIRLTNGLAIKLITNAAGLFDSLAFAALFVSIGYFFPSFVFPIILRSAELRGERYPRRGSSVGVLIAANSLGCAFGSIVTSFVLVPYLGIWTTILIVLLGYALFIFLQMPRREYATAAAIAAVFVIATNPQKYPLVTPVNPLGGPDGMVVSVKEGKYGIVSVIDYKGAMRSLWLNNTYLLEAGMNNMIGTYRIGLVPRVLHPKAKSLAMIGVGTGISASAFIGSAVENATLIELIPEVVEAAANHFSAYNGRVLEYPLVRTVIHDGRHYFRVDDKQYDIVVSDLFTPWNEGTAYLYTVDHFRNIKERLNEDGLFCLWLPLYQITREEFFIIAKSFASVFPHTTMWQIGGKASMQAVALVGAKKISSEAIIDSFGSLANRSIRPDFIELHESGIFSLYVGPVTISSSIMNSMPLNTLDRPIIEFMTAQKGRKLLRGREMIELLDLFLAAPGNPEGQYFTRYDARLDAYRLGGRYLNLYSLSSEIGDDRSADAYRELWMKSVPALSQYLR